MAVTLDSIAEEILAKVDSDFAQAFYEDSVPSAQTLRFVGGQLKPYIIVNFADIASTASRSFAGPRGDDYVLPVRFMTVAPTASLARELRSKLVDKFTGWAPEYASSFYKRAGGGTFSVYNETGGVLAYVAPVSYHCTLTLFDLL